LDGLILNVIDFLGALSSVGAAIVAGYQAYRAKSARDEILQDRGRHSLIELRSSVTRARSECGKILPKLRGKIRGVDQQNVIDTIRATAQLLRDNTHRLGEDSYKTLTNTLEEGIGRYVTVDDHEQETIADTLYKSLNDLAELISKAIDRAI
jgi:hypothetical protein